MRDATYVSNETKKLMLSYATELERERKGGTGHDGVGGRRSLSTPRK